MSAKKAPTLETRNRKPMRPNPIAPWELRIGHLRVYFEVEEGACCAHSGHWQKGPQRGLDRWSTLYPMKTVKIGVATQTLGEAARGVCDEPAGAVFATAYAQEPDSRRSSWPD
jgi:hypothetical protein